MRTMCASLAATRGARCLEKSFHQSFRVSGISRMVLHVACDTHQLDHAGTHYAACCLNTNASGLTLWPCHAFRLLSRRCSGPKCILTAHAGSTHHYGYQAMMSRINSAPQRMDLWFTNQVNQEARESKCAIPRSRGCPHRCFTSRDTSRTMVRRRCRSSRPVSASLIMRLGLPAATCTATDRICFCLSIFMCLANSLAPFTFCSHPVSLQHASCAMDHSLHILADHGDVVRRS